MSRIKQVVPATASGKAKDLFEAVKKKMGLVPNMTRAMANAPAVLDGYLALSTALSKGALHASTREQIALGVAQANNCEYCLAAHSTVGKMIGLTDAQIHDSRLGSDMDPKTDALLGFARKVVEKRGRVSNADIAAVREEGFGDDAIAEVVANVALSIFTNYFNNVAGTDLDFPKAELISERLLTLTDVV